MYHCYNFKQFKEMSFNIKEIIRYSVMFIVEQLFLQHLKFVGEKLKKKTCFIILPGSRGNHE